LEHLGQLLGLLLELALMSLMQPGQHPAGLEQRRAQALGQLPERLIGIHRAPLGHALKTACGNEMGMQGIGYRGAQVKLSDLLVHIA
jgi:hypothetical protein